MIFIEFSLVWFRFFIFNWIIPLFSVIRSPTKFTRNFIRKSNESEYTIFMKMTLGIRKKKIQGFFYFQIGIFQKQTQEKIMQKKTSELEMKFHVEKDQMS